MNIQFYHWLILGAVLMIAELFVPTFFLLWFGAAAILVGALAWVFDFSFAFSVGLWTIFSVGFCVAWFKLVQPKLALHRTKAGLGVSVIIGEIGMIVTVPNAVNAGIVRFATPKAGASEWACRTNDTLQMGESVVVLDVVGNELLVGKR